jgi:hypothetical protein
MSRDQDLLTIDDPLRRKYQVQVGWARTQTRKHAQSRHFAGGHQYTCRHKLDHGARFGWNGEGEANVERGRQLLITEFLKGVASAAIARSR